MNKTILRGVILSWLLGVTVWVSAGVGGQVKVLEVVVPDTATVVRNQGASLTGQLTAFNEKTLTLTAAGYAEAIPLSQVKSIDFEGDIWIEGKPLSSKIRGYTQTCQGIPIKAFILHKSTAKQKSTAKINLNKVSKPKDCRNLGDLKNKTPVLAKISFDSPQTMTIEAFSMPRK